MTGLFAQVGLGGPIRGPVAFKSRNRPFCFPPASPTTISVAGLYGPASNVAVFHENLERAKGFEPSTPTLANLSPTFSGRNRP